MNIMELGAIGEMVGGLAVIGSLIYVGLQVRQSNDHASQRNEIERAQAAREVTRDHNQILLAMTESEFVAVFRQGFADFSVLPPNDQARLHNWLHTFLMQCISTFLVGRSRLVDEEFSDRWVQAWVAMVSTPGLNRWWHQIKPAYHQDFVSLVDGILESDEQPASILEIIPWWAPDSSAAEA